MSSQSTPTLDTLIDLRSILPPDQFRSRLRHALLQSPDVKLKYVAQQLGVTRQRVALLVGRLNRTTCAHRDRPAPKRDHAQSLLPQLKQRVAMGETAEQAAATLNISLNQAMVLGFRVHDIRHAHGTIQRAQASPPCHCWRCRRISGIALPRGPRSGATRRALIEDWLAHVDPDTGQPLTQATVARLAGTTQPMVSRIAKASQ